MKLEYMFVVGYGSDRVETRHSQDIGTSLALDNTCSTVKDRTHSKLDSCKEENFSNA